VVTPQISLEVKFMSKLSLILIPLASMAVLAACDTGPSDAEVRAMVQAEVSQALAQMQPELIGPQGLQGLQGEPGPPADGVLARVRTESFQFVSESGTSRGVLTLVDGEPMIGLLGTDSGVRGSFSLSEGIPQLTLSDDAGSERATLALEQDGSPFVWLGDAAGNLRVSLSTLDDIPALSLGDHLGTIRTALVLDPDGLPGLRFSDPAGNVRGLLSGDSNGDTSLTFSDARGNVRTILDSDGGSSFLAYVDDAGASRMVLGLRENDLSPLLRFQDEAGATRVDLSLIEDQSRLTFNDPGGNPHIILSMLSDGGRSLLAFLDDAGTIRMVLGLGEDGSPELRMLDASGSVIFEAP
jgi:hypothetical protein